MNTFSDNSSAHERLIDDLATDLMPVRRLRSPAVRALGWLSVVAATAVVLAMIADLPALERRLTAVPDMWLAVAGSTGTAIRRLRRVSAEPAGRAPRLGNSSPACGPVVDRRQWRRLLARVVIARNPCRRPRRDARLPDFHRRTVGTAVGVAYRDAAARMSTAAGIDRRDRRACGGRRRRDAAQLFPSFRRRGDRSRGACCRGGPRHRGKPGLERTAARHKFSPGGVTCTMERAN